MGIKRAHTLSGIAFSNHREASVVDIETLESGRSALVRVSGDVVTSTSPRVREILLGLAARRVAAIVVDMGRVGYMDSSGLAALVEGLREIRRYGGMLRLASLTPGVRKVIGFYRFGDFGLAGEYMPRHG